MLLNVEGVSIEASWCGDQTAPTLVLLHEGLGSVALWRDFPQRLAHATGCGVFAYSRPGYGHSDPVPLPRPLTYMHDEARRLPAVLDAAGIRRAILLGHSDGASIAAIAAGSHYDPRIRALVLIAPHFFVEPESILAIEAIKVAYQSGNLRNSLAKYHRDVDTAFWGWNGAWLDPDFRTWRIDEFLPHIRLPILLLQGEVDRYGTVAQLRLVDEIAYGPVETRLIPHAGHSPHLDAPHDVTETIAAFTARVWTHEHAL